MPEDRRDPGFFSISFERYPGKRFVSFCSRTDKPITVRSGYVNFMDTGAGNWCKRNFSGVCDPDILLQKVSGSGDISFWYVLANVASAYTLFSTSGIRNCNRILRPLIVSTSGRAGRR